MWLDRSATFKNSIEFAPTDSDLGINYCNVLPKADNSFEIMLTFEEESYVAVFIEKIPPTLCSYFKRDAFWIKFYFNPDIPLIDKENLFKELIQHARLDKRVINKIAEFTRYSFYPSFDELKAMSPAEAIAYASQESSDDRLFELGHFYKEHSNNWQDSLDCFTQIAENSPHYIAAQQEIYHLLMSLSSHDPDNREYSEHLFITTSNLAKITKGKEHDSWQREADRRLNELCGFSIADVRITSTQPTFDTLLALAKQLKSANEEIAKLKSQIGENKAHDPKNQAFFKPW